ncbi:Transcriptional regulatory protein ZraR [Symmachiella dynata]|uniref:Transcriptional regulatory protein ZraR n=2 Tax=Symmachiella dynata TaxID=2527995 RepID=A0A517ZH31_9PLAN|nr:Transcriptional regulatory protein ZraR [Symmachiella dynata]
MNLPHDSGNNSVIGSALASAPIFTGVDTLFRRYSALWIGKMARYDGLKPARRWPLVLAGIAVLVYSIIVLGFVSQSRDLGLRCLMPNEEDLVAAGEHPENEVGVRIDRVFDVTTDGDRPQEGSRLLSIGGQPVRTFTEFTQALANLRSTPTPVGSFVPQTSDSEEHAGPIVEKLPSHERWIEVEFFKEDGDPSDPYSPFLQEKRLPLGALSLSLVWFTLHLGIFVVGAMAYWKRPFDAAARMFFAMCIVTVVAFVGGYHWWVIAARLWLNIPFAICAMLVPVVTLHFFLVFPHRKPWFARHPRTILAAIYALPLAATTGMVTLLCYSAWQHAHSDAYALGDLLFTLSYIQKSIYGYLAVATVYFVATLYALYDSYQTTKNTAEHNQVKWILWAAAASTLPVGYTLLLALNDRVEFAVGHARFPMFIASLLFMMAYAVGIIRYKLMLVDQVFSRGTLYFLLSFGVLIVYSLAITLSSLLGMMQDMQFLHQVISVTPVVLVAVILLGWIRDRVQQTLDRSFYREKYQLDKVMQGMNQAVAHLGDHLGDPATLGQQMLTSCHDVLHINQAAVYLRSGPNEDFNLIAVQGDMSPPARLANDPELTIPLLENASLQRTSLGGRGPRSKVQTILRELDVDLIHRLEMEGELAGFVLLGRKRDDSAYTAEDLTFLTALGQIMTLHSSKVHDEITRLNKELSLKTERVAEQQRQISILQSEIMGSRDPQKITVQGGFRNELIRGNSKAIRQLLDTVQKVSHSESSVLIRGESGTGKELLAQTLHMNSPRHEGPMVRVHCAALSPSLLESELFGHSKGAFTGAHRDKEGRFEMANGGTLFLDEIGDISLETQVKLLRVLQERSFEPVGGTRTIQVDVRLVTATHQDLESLILQGRFREDLYYRLNVISMTLPPLRDRVDDIFELARHFLGRAAQRIGKPISHLDDETVDILKQYPWPGNIRELENVIERAVVLADDEVITPGDLPREILFPNPSQLQLGSQKRHAPSGKQPVAGGETEKVPVAVPAAVGDNGANEEQQLRDALSRCGGNKARAARLLGMPRSTYYSRLKKYRIS